MTPLPKAHTPDPIVSEPAVALAIADFLARTERDRQRLFRDHLRATVVGVSPLLLQLAALEGVDVLAAVGVMKPPADWPWRPLYQPSHAVMRQWHARRLLLGVEAVRGAARFKRAYADPGVVIRDVDDPRGRFAVRPGAGSLDFTVGVGTCLLSAVGAMAVFRLPERLPEAVLAAMPGRRLDDIVDHAAFRGRKILIRSVVTGPADDLPMLSFRIPIVPFSVAWPEDR